MIAAVAPPGRLGCNLPFTASSAPPAGRLVATGVFKPVERAVRVALLGETESTELVIRAYALDGRRVDAFLDYEYSCGTPSASLRLVFPVKANTVGAAIRAHGNDRVRVVVRMINANGVETTLRRVIRVTA
ncbi:MAG TPA: hypothetical protein VIJ51_16380 [Solirubrobacteraceae bacterium]